MKRRDSSSNNALVFIDTNFWLLPYRYKIDIFSELDRILLRDYEIIVSDGVIRELEGIKRGAKGGDKVAANVGLGLISNKNLRILPSDDFKGKNVDDFIIHIAEKSEELIVCTNDKELREKLKAKGIRVIIMKEKKKLSFFS